MMRQHEAQCVIVFVRGGAKVTSGFRAVLVDEVAGGSGWGRRNGRPAIRVNCHYSSAYRTRGCNAFLVFERFFEGVDFRVTHAKRSCVFTPRCDGVINSSKNVKRAHFREAKDCGSSKQVFNRGRRSRVFTNPRLQFACAFRKRVDVKRGRQSPLSSLNVEKTVIVKMIINVRDQDGECDSSPKFFEVGLCIRAMRTNR